ncbi:hypothetical protein LTR17_023731 [Elasticomyces elasticus]|nr:hypothetical protein LTR17_023731 [Elasticomyces elasticus]
MVQAALIAVLVIVVFVLLVCIFGILRSPGPAGWASQAPPRGRTKRRQNQPQRMQNQTRDQSQQPPQPPVQAPPPPTQQQTTNVDVIKPEPVLPRPVFSRGKAPMIADERPGQDEIDALAEVGMSRPGRREMASLASLSNHTKLEGVDGYRERAESARGVSFASCA